ncbi:hypothetical protein E4U13_006572 [Claviceps humidiphila]|uniref:Uncharacterized protein n=1 Tax=Claviceps humidiphila TaxID=1294629 RepID=A0A9P7PWE3_9HYPO|nr:hypothetical protein E4U13_006572 [Claviceps humidiphila]
MSDSSLPAANQYDYEYRFAHGQPTRTGYLSKNLEGCSLQDWRNLKDHQVTRRASEQLMYAFKALLFTERN